MNRIVRENYPVADLPEDLREGLATDANVRVTIEAVPRVAGEPSLFDRPDEGAVLSLKDLFALRRPPYQSTEEIVDEIRRLRDEWDD